MRVAAPLFLLAALGAQTVLAWSDSYDSYDARSVGGAFNGDDELAIRGFYDDEDYYGRDYFDDDVLGRDYYDDELLGRDYDDEVLGRDYDDIDSYSARDLEAESALFVRRLEEELSMRSAALKELKAAKDASTPKIDPATEAEAKEIQEALDAVPARELSKVNCETVALNLDYFHRAVYVMKGWIKKLKEAKESGDAAAIAKAEKEVADWKQNVTLYMWGVLAHGRKDNLAAARNVAIAKAAQAMEKNGAQSAPPAEAPPAAKKADSKPATKA